MSSAGPGAVRADRAGTGGEALARLRRARVRGLYAITPDGLPAGELARRVGAALLGGARLVQYRDKTSGPAERRARAAALLELARAAGAALVINDDLELALALGADGVHLGREDGDPRGARARLAPWQLLGVSCYAEADRARLAAEAGADYVAFGSFFASTVKPHAPRADAALVREAKARLGLPVVAIGGIDAANLPPLIEAGVDAAAVITAVFGAPDVESAARRLSALFESTPRGP